MNPGLQPLLSKINPQTKTITTPVGDLPISPLLDQSYHENRTRWTKPKAPPRTTMEKQKWRRQLERNPWALALATPVRRCPGTMVALPKFFLQEFNIVLHPETEEPFYVPSSLMGTTQPVEGGITTSSKKEKVKRPVGPSSYLLLRRDYMAQQVADGEVHRNDYRKLMVMHHSRDRYKHVSNQAVWRTDMDGFILELMRRRVMEDLVYLSTLSADTDRDPYVVRCGSWEEVQDDRYRGQRACVLWLGGEGEKGPGPRATLDVPGVKYGRKIAVHNLWTLLGRENVERLRREVGVFKTGEVFLVLRRRTVGMQMKLWRLQGYLAHEVGKGMDGQDEKTTEGEERKVEEGEGKRTGVETPGKGDGGDVERQVPASRRTEVEKPLSRREASF